MSAREAFVVCDPHDVTRWGLRHYVGAVSGLPVLEARDKSGLVELLRGHPRSVVVVDYSLLDVPLETLENLSLRYPESSWLVFSGELGAATLRRIAQGGRLGVVLKECDGSELEAALRSALSGGRYVCQAAREAGQAERAGQLTQSEREVLRLIAHGRSVKEIAAERHSSTHTIVAHKKNLFRKLDVSNVYEATRYALQSGLVDMMEYYI